MKLTKLLSVTAMERLPWISRALLGSASAGVAVVLTYTIPPLRAFPLLLSEALLHVSSTPRDYAIFLAIWLLPRRRRRRLRDWAAGRPALHSLVRSL